MAMQIVKESGSGKRFVTTQEAAQELDCGIATIHRMIGSGELPTVRITDRAVRIKRSVLQEVAQTRRKEREEAEERLRGLLTIDRVAEELTLSPITVRRLIRRGVLPSVKISDHAVRVHPDAVEKYIKERMEQ